MSNFAYTANQTRAITYLHGNVRVIAGAGSGKTKVLVKRYLYILGDNYSDDPLDSEQIIDLPEKNTKAGEILAITFTEKAGKEMSERIYKRLLDILQVAADKEYWQKCISELASAHVGTMHSFYSKIIKENPIEAKIDPNFTLLSSLSEEYEKKTFNQNYMRKLLKEQDLNFGLIYADYNMLYIEDLLNFVTRLAANLPNNLPEFCEVWADNLHNPHNLSAALTEFRALLGETFSPKNIQELRKKTTKSNTALLSLLEHAELWAADVAAEDYAQLLTDKSDLLAAVFGTLRTNSKIGGSLKKAFQNLLQQEKLLAISQKAQQIIQPLSEFLFAYLSAWRQYKAENNLLTFDDTENICGKLLLEYPEILNKYQKRYKHILVDEVQDLNDIQHSIIDLLTAHTQTVLFSVGDKKQSIYGFRGSSIKTETKAQEVIALDTNFRSQAGIIQACNEFFKNYTEHKRNNVQFEGLQAFRASVAPNLATAFFAKDDDRELEYLSKHILDIHKNKGVLFEDIAILIRNNKQAADICHYLEQYNIPYNVSGRAGFFQDLYIQDLLNLLTCINNKYAQIELIGVLRSPFFAISDQGLTELYAAHDNLWDALADKDIRENNAQGPLLERAFSIIGKLSEQSKYLTISQLLKEILYTHNWQSVALMHADYLQNLANLNKFSELVSEFENEYSPYITEFIEYLTMLKEDLAAEELPNIVHSTQMGVNIMSIHKSKGLEFSHVILPQLQKIASTSRGGNKIYQFDSEQIKVGLKVYLEQDKKHAATNSFEAIKAANQELDEHENLRILYVAMTRARDFLLLSGTKQSATDKNMRSALEWLQTYLPNCPQLDLEELQTVLPLDKLSTAPLSEAEYLLSMANTASICAVQASALDKLTASSIHEYQLCPLMFKYKNIMQLPDLGYKVATDSLLSTEHSRVVGLLVHKLLEKGAQCPLSEILPECEFLSELDAQQAAVVISRAQLLFDNYTNSKLYLDNRHVFYKQEYPFTFFHKECSVLINGLIDCIWRYADGSLGIIDYKTGKQLDEYLDFYKLQVSLYALVAEQIFRKPVKYLSIHHISETVQAIDLSPAEYQVYKNKAQAMIAAIASATASNEFAANTANCALCTFAYLCPLSKQCP